MENKGGAANTTCPTVHHETIYKKNPSRIVLNSLRNKMHFRKGEENSDG